MITVSDGVHSRTREDLSGDALAALLVEHGFDVAGRPVVPDELEQIAEAIVAASTTVDFIVTTGGTGFGPRDVTPEATATVLDRTAPGLVHLMLSEGVISTPMAALSRPQAGVVGRALVVNLPGSPRGSTENLSAVIGVVPHALALLSGDTEHVTGTPDPRDGDVGADG